MSGTLSTVRFVARLDGEAMIDETFPHELERVQSIGKSFTVEMLGSKAHIDVEFHFEPAVGA